MNLRGLRIGLVGPLPPPEGGMANQTRQLAELLESEGARITHVRTNAPFRPRWIEKLRGVRGIARLVPYVARLWSVAANVDLFHIMANSGWSWHLCAAPAVWVAKMRGIPVVVNYRGGDAKDFLERSGALVLKTLRFANVLAVPSGFLERIFGHWGVRSRIVPNIVDLGRFCPGAVSAAGEPPHLVVARSFEQIYDVATALRAFALVRKNAPHAKLTIAGSGPEHAALVRLAGELDVSAAVSFCGRLDRERMAELYRSARIVINPSRVDNMPNSVLEAMASGVPVVSTNVGGVPFIVRDGVNALLVAPGDHVAMAAAVERLLRDPELAKGLRQAALSEVQRYAWPQVRQQWVEVYASVLGASRRDPAPRGMYTRVVSRLVFPLHERLKGHDSFAVRRSLEESQWWPRERLESVQLARLRALLEHAGEQVPYYRELFRRLDFAPGELRSIGNISRLPLLTKADIRANLAALKSSASRELVRFNTGGSSGEPLIFFLGKERISHDVAAKWRATRWWGVDIGDPEIVVWGSPIELGAQDRLRGMRDALMRTELLPAFEMSEAKLSNFVARIRRRRPKMLFGYPSALAHIARHAEARGIALDDLSVRVAFVTAERLYDDQRSAIERVFGCRVANGYGSREGGFIAHQCPAGGMHITAEDIVVEIVDEAGYPLGAEREGEIVVTHLATREFPFIRYRTGDVGILSNEKCACGRTLPLLKEIQGRATDFVVARDGTTMHGLALIYVIRDIPGVRQFKVIQESLERTRVLLATDEAFSDKNIDAIRCGIGKRLGDGVRVQIDRVGHIPHEPSGKYRYVVSHVAARPSAVPALTES